MAQWLVAQALTTANNGLTALQSDARLDQAERALCGELVQQNTLALNALDANGIIPPGQRNARATAIQDKVFAVGVVQAAHEVEFTPAEFYNYLNLSSDAAIAILKGEGSFTVDL